MGQDLIHEEFIRKLAHRYKQPLAQLSAIFVKLSVLATLKESVESKTLIPLCEQGENILSQMGRFLTDGELFSLIPPDHAPIAWSGLLEELSLLGVSFPQTLNEIPFSSHPILFPHVLKALAAYHTRHTPSLTPIQLTHSVTETFFSLEMTITSHLWDKESYHKILDPLYENGIPPHMDLSILAIMVSHHLNGELTLLYEPSRCGFTLTLPC